MSLKQELANYGPWAKSSLLLVLVNKLFFFLENLPPCLFVYIVYGCLWVTVARLSNCDSDCMAKPKIFTIWSFVENVCQPPI